ncbi:MAG TPA: biotin/lipoate--protein ligase family protein [Geminicoccaceae bacterium]
MSERPSFPPLFRPFAVTPDVDPFERAEAIAVDGAEPGTLLWSIGQDACECAIVLAPEQSQEASMPVALVAMLALGDALGALVPPVVAVHFGWPDRLELNGAIVGGIRLVSAKVDNGDQIPDWLIVGFGLAMRGTWPEREPGHDLQRTTLADEGCADVTSVDLLEGFSRHFLSWLNRWQEDGVQPVRQAWLARATGLGRDVEVDLGDRKMSGTFAGLTETGAIRLVKGGVTQTVPLHEATRRPSWVA